MGVPALFRWLSKKYPKIVDRVIEEDPIEVPSDEDAEGMVKIPVDITGKNPNGVEFDNLYLDMNGIVHPCTHPEGKPAPETEEDMMLEIFEYTERVVAMIRPRKLLFMAIDGVAPRAKMNQQRSRRFRAAQEAKDKEREKEESIALFAAMGHPVSEETQNKKAWDSNAITPGTPFMDLLAASLRYWVVQKMNTDAGWKNMQVIISDASVPGEGEHKIMDFIRRQRSHPEHNPNTEHVIYGLDADLIMLALATHEPHFKVLREDVFFQPNGGQGCRKCGDLGHQVKDCKGEALKPVKSDKPLSETKPFIFLDVSILREYLTIELDVPQTPFAFDLERALDDWVFLIFFVGNDFLPHLPSLEIREGAIDTLLKIWKKELPRMGGYVTNHGRIELERAEIILEGLARSEDDIFRRRREAEERQDANQKRRKVEEARRAGKDEPHFKDKGGQDSRSNLVGMQLNGETLVQVVPAKPSTSNAAPAHPSLPSRPAFDLVPAKEDPTSTSSSSLPSVPAPPLPDATFPPMQRAPEPAKPVKITEKAKGIKALGGSNNDLVANRRAIRMANMSAAEMLKAELAGVAGEKVDDDTTIEEAKEMHEEKEEEAAEKGEKGPEEKQEDSVMADGEIPIAKEADITVDPDQSASDAAFDAAFPPPAKSDVSETPSRGTKRKADEDDDDEDESKLGPGDDGEEAPDKAELTSIPHMDQPVEKPTGRVVNADGTVEYEDTVKLWEPGYQERYYRDKFGVELSDKEFRKKITTHYIEGLCWVLHYYYQGTPSWQWYYPYHYAPFAADFEEVGKMDIQFTLGAPFKPFEQLMGVFPAASKVHIPEIFHDLMTDEFSPIIEFYPSDFDIDMNGKKMAWQGVALLPFIDPVRLLEHMTPRYGQLSEDDTRRNSWGTDVLFVADDHRLYDAFCKLYAKKKVKEPVPMDPSLSGGITGFVLPDPTCVPGSTYYTPLPSTTLGDIYDDHSLSVSYSFPKQLTPHRSVMLGGVKHAKRVLNQQDLDRTRRGGNDTRGRGGGGGMGGPGTGYGGRRGDRRGGGNDGSNYNSPQGGSPYDRSYNNSPHSSYGGSQRGTPNSYGPGARGAGGRDGYPSPTPGGGGAYSAGNPSSYGQSRIDMSTMAASNSSYQSGYQGGGGSYGGYGGPPTLPVQNQGHPGNYAGYGGSGNGGYAAPPPPPGYGGYGGGPPPPQSGYGGYSYGNSSRGGRGHRSGY